MEQPLPAELARDIAASQLAYQAQRTEIATRLLIAALQDGEEHLNPHELVQVCVALTDTLLAELANPTPRHRQ